MGIETWLWFGFVGGGASLLFALFQLRRLLSGPREETPSSGLSSALRKGSFAWLRWQLLLSGGALSLVFLLLSALSGLGLLDWMLPAAFLSSGLCGLLVGLTGILVSPAAGLRSAEAAGRRLDCGIHTVLSAGAVTGFLAVGLALTHLTGWLFWMRQYVGGSDTVIRLLPLSGLGSAFTALLFHVGTVFARSAEMTAESAARELELPPDSPWNPALIARGVGYGAGSASNLAVTRYCIYENLLFASLFWGSSAYTAVDMTWNAMLFPLLVAVAGALLSPVGFLSFRPMERGDCRSLPRQLRLAALVPTLLTAAVSIPLTYFWMGSRQLCPPVFLGLAAGLLLPLAGEIFTADIGRPARSLAETCAVGPAAAANGALGAGACSSLPPLLLTAGVFIAAFLTGGGAADPFRGFYGVTLAGVGMLSLSGISLSAAESDPIGKYAQFIVSLSEPGETPRRGADALAAMGAPAAIGGTCLSAAAASLVGLALLPRLTQLEEIPAQPGLPLLLGAAAGLMSVLLFPGLFLRGVQTSAGSALALVRRQFSDRSELPDHAVCVRQCSVRSLTGFLPPLLLALAVPPAVGILLRAQGLLGFVGSVLLLNLALFLPSALSDGLLDGALRYVEAGRNGGRDSCTHRSLLAARDAVAAFRTAAAALPALALFSAALSLLCLPLLEYIPPLWG